MSHYLLGSLACLVLPFAMFGCAVHGYRVARRKRAAASRTEELGSGIVDAAVLSLLGLLTAFTFSNA